MTKLLGKILIRNLWKQNFCSTKPEAVSDRLVIKGLSHIFRACKKNRFYSLTNCSPHSKECFQFTSFKRILISPRVKFSHNFSHSCVQKIVAVGQIYLDTATFYVGNMWFRLQLKYKIWNWHSICKNNF